MDKERFVQQRRITTDNDNFVDDVIAELERCPNNYTVMDVCVQSLAPIWKNGSDFVETCPVLDSVGVIEFTSSIVKLMNSVYNELLCDDDCFQLTRIHVDMCTSHLKQYYNRAAFNK